MSLEVFISDPVVIDLECFQLYLNGEAVEDSAEKLAHVDVPDRTAHLALQQRHCEDQYRVYHMIESYLGDPSSEAAASLKFQLPRTVVDELRARYYAFDDPVMRCFVGRKLTGKQLTKDLGDIASRTRVSFR